jgi:DNA-binding transcriptional MerR regulator
MKETKKQYRIGYVAQAVGVEKFVIRFWEKEFQLKSDRSDGGQRFYAKKDIEQFKTIKSLLYEQGLTIAGARKALENGENIIITASQKTTMHPEEQKTNAGLPKSLTAQLIDLQRQLIKLQKLL